MDPRGLPLAAPAAAACQDGWNRKGLIGQNGTRKKAFFVLKDFYRGIARREQATPADVLSLMEKVADWQLAHLEPVASITNMREETRSPRSWQQGAFYAGLTELAHRRSVAALQRSGARSRPGTNWQLGDRKYHADDHVIGQSYLWASTHGAGPRRSRRCAGASTKFSQPAEVGLVVECRSGSAGTAGAGAMRCSWRRLSGSSCRPQPATARYAAYAHAEFKATHDSLYDTKSTLFYRDSRFFEQRDRNGPQDFLESRQWLGLRRSRAPARPSCRRTIPRDPCTNRCSRKWRRS